MAIDVKDKAVKLSEIKLIYDELKASSGGGTGDGDMLKSTYDANNNGIVDNAEKVNGHTVLSDVPLNAKFTDTVYDDTSISGRISAIEAKETSWDNKSDFDGDYESLTNKPTIPTVPTAEISANTNARHTHTNKTVIDSITQAKINSWDSKSTFSGNYSDLSGKPTKLSDFTDDLGTSPTHTHSQYLTSFTETDPTVPAWAKAENKPTYNASEVGLGNVGNFKAVSTVASQGLTSTEQSNARANIGAGTGTYSKPSGGIPKTDLASAVQTSLGLADSALQSESDPIFSASPASGITSANITSWNNKVDKVEGKGLSTNDLTATLKSNYDAAYSNTHTHSNKSVLDNIKSTDIISWNNKVDSVSGKGLSSNDLTNTLKSNYDTAYSNSHTHSNKSILDNISSTTISGWNNKAELSDIPTSDISANTSARHTHTNKSVIDSITLDDLSNWDSKSNFSGDYNDLENKPEIPDFSEYLKADDSGTAIDPNPINADRLQGYSANDFAKKANQTFTGTTTFESAQVNGTLAVSSNAEVTGKLTVGNNAMYDVPMVRNVLFSTTAPTSEQGRNGDIWIVFAEE